jgi:hypothetical protein
LNKLTSSIIFPSPLFPFPFLSNSVWWVSSRHLHMSSHVDMQHTSIFFFPSILFFPSTSAHLFPSPQNPPYAFVSHYYLSSTLFRTRFHKWTRTCSIWPFELGFSCSPWCSSVPFIFLHDSIFHYGWGIFHIYIPCMYICIIFSLSIHWLLGTWAVSVVCLLWGVLQ